MVSRIETKVGIRAQGLRPGVYYSLRPLARGRLTMTQASLVRCRALTIWFGVACPKQQPATR